MRNQICSSETDLRPRNCSTLRSIGFYLMPEFVSVEVDLQEEIENADDAVLRPARP
jgi:hypothetical protein